MKTKTILTLTAAALIQSLSAQTNTFPTSGNVGIGTTSTTYKLEVYNGSIRVKNDSSANAQIQLETLGAAQGDVVFTEDGLLTALLRLDSDSEGGTFAMQDRVDGGKTRFYINGSGNVGIGTITPGALLNVGTKSYNQNSNIAMFGESVPSGEAQVLSLVNSGGGSGQSTSISFHNAASWSETGKIQVKQNGNSTTSEMHFFTYNSGVKRRMLIDSYGNVGIGTTNTNSARLSVAGTIRAEEVIVETGWADFVFEDGYKLRSLNEVESHINDNGHLPDVPSASTVEAEGLSIGKAQKIMMQKIEELTLYIIEQDKKNAALQIRVEELESN